jgi:hypothetical protein
MLKICFPVKTNAPATCAWLFAPESRGPLFQKKPSRPLHVVITVRDRADCWVALLDQALPVSVRVMPSRSKCRVATGGAVGIKASR